MMPEPVAEKKKTIRKDDETEFKKEEEQIEKKREIPSEDIDMLRERESEQYDDDNSFDDGEDY